MVAWIFDLTGATRCLVACVAAALFAQGVAAQGFKFEQDPGSRGAGIEGNAADQPAAAQTLSSECRQLIKGQRTMIIIGEEQTDGRIVAQQPNYGQHFQAINSRLHALGVRALLPEVIQRQIAQAEIDAYFRNDPDAALGAAQRLGAKFVLRGLITSRSSVNPVLRVNQVSVGMGFVLEAGNGRVLANANAAASSYAGPDVRGMALTLLEEQADEVLARLYGQYCRRVKPGPGAKGAVGQ